MRARTLRGPREPRHNRSTANAAVAPRARNSVAPFLCLSETRSTTEVKNVFPIVMWPRSTSHGPSVNSNTTSLSPPSPCRQLSRPRAEFADESQVTNEENGKTIVRRVGERGRDRSPALAPAAVVWRHVQVLPGPEPVTRALSAPFVFESPSERLISSHARGSRQDLPMPGV